MDHVGIVVGDLEAATGFFLALGFELRGEASVGGDWVDRMIDLDGARSNIAMLRTPDGHNQVELTEFQSPPVRQGDADAPSNTLGLRHLAFVVDDVDAALEAVRDHGGELIGTVERYQDIFRLCYVRGPDGIIVELAEELGR
jgi:catechol 2,3-dioxygenase-like lactoylglutathione lyase family enzyme